MLNICSFYRAFASVEAEGTTGGAGLRWEASRGAGRTDWDGSVGAWKMGKQQMRQEQHYLFSANPKAHCSLLLSHLEACFWLNDLHNTAAAWIDPCVCSGDTQPCHRFGNSDGAVVWPCLQPRQKHFQLAAEAVFWIRSTQQKCCCIRSLEMSRGKEQDFED